MKKVIMTGATGMVGSIVLRECLANPDIGKVTSLVRRPCGVTHDKLSEVIISNFANYSNSEGLFKNQDIAFFCIGVYTGTVPRDEFRKITVDYTTAFAGALKKHSPNATFCFLSGMGADRTGKSRMTFAQDKGIAENYLIRQQFGRLHMFRPGYIYPVVPRKEPNLGYRIWRALYPVLKVVTPNGVVTSEHLGKAMFVTGLNGGSMETYENKDIRAVG